MRVNLRAYLQLLRPANVMTAVADVLAGFAIAGEPFPGVLPPLVAATACLYAGGVTLNDVFDRRIDGVERPERPIPSGRVPVSSAAALGALLLAGGIVAASRATREAGLLAAAIAALVLLYDAWGKRHAVGPLNMGLCRALNLLLGVAAAPAALARNWPLALLPLTYIAAVTALSRGEVHGGRRRTALGALISLSLVLLTLAAVTLHPAHRTLAGPVLVAVFGWRVWPPFWRAYRTPEPVMIRRAVKAGVLSLVLMDAVIGVTYGGPLYGAAILATGVAAGALARLFSVT